MTDADVKQIKDVLRCCQVAPECDKCPYDWMEDHGELCYPVMAREAIKYINLLERRLKEHEQD